MIEPDGSGGWFMSGLGGLNASAHITMAWCDEIHWHQIRPKGVTSPSFHRLRYLLQTETGDAVEVERLVHQTLSDVATGRRTPDEDLRDWIKEQRATR